MPDPIISGDTWGVIRTKINDLLGLTETVGASAAAAALSAQQAALFDTISLTSENDIATDTTLTYNTGFPTTVVPGDVVWAGTRRYLVLAGGASSWSIANANGVKLIYAQDEVCPEMFGRIGVSAAQDRAAIQAALDTGKNVFFPSPSYTIDASLVVGNQRLKGIGNASTITRHQVLISVIGNVPCFLNPTGNWNSFEIDGFFIDYGETAPVSDVGNNQKIGFRFVGTATYPENFKISNCVVRGAWYGFYDLSGSYMSILDRVEARRCKIGFFKQGGTTMVYSNCFARGDGVNSEMGFWIREGIGSTFISCAADLLKPGINAYAETANMFEGCPGLTIAGWDAETNDIAANKSYMRFTDTGGSVSITGFLGFRNVLRANTGQESTLLLFDGVNASVSGKMRFGTGDLTYVGTGGVPITIKAINGAKVDVVGSDVPAATGGSPGAAFAMLGDVGTINYSASNVTGIVSGGGEYITQESAAALPLGELGTVGMFLNATTNLIVEGQIVAGTSLIYSGASGFISGVNSPTGSWMCLGTCDANTSPAVMSANCVSIFKRVL